MRDLEVGRLRVGAVVETAGPTRPTWLFPLIRRIRVEGVTDKQIELVTTFADQAAIGIENARLLSELRARDADLTEALEQQTATSEILRVISSSPIDVQPVFEAVVRSARALCVASFGGLFARQGAAVRCGAGDHEPRDRP